MSDFAQPLETQNIRMRKQSRNILISVALVAAIIILAIWASRPGPTNPAAAQVFNDDHVAGTPTAKAILVEYSDFQCPACGQYEPIVEQVRQHYGDTIGLVYRHYPLAQHKYSQQAARAAEAAGIQGKFWEYHDLLFARQNSWSGTLDIDAVLKGYADELSVDLTKFASDINSTSVKNKVTQDISRGNQAGVQGTPTFLLNGKKITPQNFADFKDLLDKVLAI